jgi:hypothetical protein
VRAGNYIEADGAASLAPSLGLMTQLTELYLGSTLRAIGWACAVANAGNVVMMLRVVGWGGWARGCSGRWGLRGESRGAAVRAGNRIGDDGAASLAPSLGRMAQLTSLDLGGTLRAIGWACAVANAGNVVMMLCVVGRGGWAIGCSGWLGLARGERRGGSACRQWDRR